MFTFAFLIGIYIYILFILGIFSLLYKPIIVSVSLIWVFLVIFIYRKKIRFQTFCIPQGKLARLIFLVILLQAFINLVGALGPELSFDALWYHLTIPKLYLLHHKIYHIGGVLFYSDLPKTAEMLYLGALSFGNEIWAKVIHFIFGILSCIALYKLSRKFVPRLFALLAVVTFYSNLVVAWESTTAYVDLVWTFFETTALLALILWYETKKTRYFLISALLVGFSLCTKFLAFGSLSVFIILLFYIFIQQKMNLFQTISKLFIFIFFGFLVPLPWYIFSYIQNGNPFYPFFTNITYVSHASGNLLNPLTAVKDFWMLFTHADDPLSPIYIAFLPLSVIAFIKTTKKQKVIFLYVIFTLGAWYFYPRTGGGRFILPYLPGLSLATVISIYLLNNPRITKIFVLFTFLSICACLGFRAIANAKFVQVLLGKETKSEFLTKNLNFQFGDFYDTDGYFSTRIKPSQTVLLLGFHNLYYVDFPFIDASWYNKTDKINFIATQNMKKLPKNFTNFKQIYQNPITEVKLYANN